MSAEQPSPAERIAAADRALRDARAELDESVVAARREKVTWREIGDVLGVTRQGARDRFGRLADA